MKRTLFTLIAAAALTSAAQAQDLIPVKTWTPQTVSWTPSVFADGVDFNAADSKGVGAYEGLEFQGPDKFYHFYNGVHNQNSGGRHVILLDSKIGQRIRVTAQIEEGSRVGSDGTCVYAGTGTKLRTMSNPVTAGTKGVAEASFDPATMQQVVVFDVTADAARFFLNRTGGFTKIELCDVETLTDETRATYTVKFVDENGTEIKDAVVREGKIGSNPEFLYGDDAIVITETGKYNYVSNDFADVTLAATGSVATVKFQSVEKWTVTFNYVNSDTEESLATETAVVYSDAPQASYNAWPADNQGYHYAASANKDLGLPGGDTDNYSVVFTANGETADIMCLGAAEYYDCEGYGIYFYTEAEDVENAPAAYDYVGASGGRIAQVKGGHGDATQLVQLGLYPVGNYVIVSDIIANQGRNCVLRSAKKGPDTSWTDASGNAMVYTAAGEIKAFFTVTEADCDTTLADGVTPAVALTWGGKDQLGDGTKYNQSADYDFVVVFKEGWSEIPGDGIEEIFIERNGVVTKDDAVYDLMGRKVTGKLSRGIYVCGGKKFFVK